MRAWMFAMRDVFMAGEEVFENENVQRTLAQMIAGHYRPFWLNMMGWVLTALAVTPGARSPDETAFRACLRALGHLETGECSMA